MSLLRHKQLHHDTLDLSRNDIVVQTYSVSKNEVLTPCEDTEIDENPFEDVEIDEINSEIKDEVDIENNTDDSPDTVKDDDAELSTEDSEIYSFRNALPKCVECGVCFATIDSYASHLNTIHKDGVMPPIVECEICNLKFFEKLLPRHNVRNHSQGETRNDFFVIPIRSSGILTMSRYVFQCKICLATFSQRPETFMIHISKGSHAGITKECDLCGLLVSVNNFFVHEKSCRESMQMWSREDIVILQQADNSHFRVPRSKITDENTKEEEELFRDKNGKVLIFKCDCGLHFSYPNSHIKSKLGCLFNEHTQGCSWCSLPFQNLKGHIQKHHVEMKLSKEDYRIIGRKEIERKTLLKSGAACRKLYYCELCQIHMLDYFVLLAHRKFCNSSKREEKQCYKCHLQFSTKCLDDHIEFHHAYQNLKVEDFEILNVTLDRVESSITETTITVKDSDKVICEPKTITDKITTLNQDLYTNELFKCSKCSLHFLLKESLEWHMKNSKHDEFKLHCTVCQFGFTPQVLSVHVFIHHDKLNFKAHEFYVICETDDKISSDSGDKVSIDNEKPAENIDGATRKSALKHSPFNNKPITITPNDNAKKDTENKTTDNDDIKPSTSKTDEKQSQIGVADSSGTSDDAIDDTSPKIAKQNKIKLYKCGACNVCFLNQQSCYKHTNKHVPLEARTYIECKLCGYQFPIVNTLQWHMTRHHKTEFKLENVLIEEYHPDIIYQGAPKIDIYRGSDKVQSKLVSTTTEKDSNVTDSSSMDIDVEL